MGADPITPPTVLGTGRRIASEEPGVSRRAFGVVQSEVRGGFSKMALPCFSWAGEAAGDKGSVTVTATCVSRPIKAYPFSNRRFRGRLEYITHIEKGVDRRSSNKMEFFLLTLDRSID